MLLSLLAQSASAQKISNTIFFGDSLTDSGRYLYIPKTIGDPATLSTGVYTTNPGLMWSTMFGQKFGVTVTPSDSPVGGNNFAAGGALISFTPAGSNQWSTTSQVTAYLAQTGGIADPNALYTVWTGINDMPAALTNGAVTTLGQQAAKLVIQLSAAGAKYILVPNLPTYSSPAAAAASGGTYGPGADRRILYDQTMWNTIAAQGVNFIPADMRTIFNYVLLNPLKFGFTNTNSNTPACGVVEARFCTATNLVSPNAENTFLHADSLGHTTSAFQKITTDYFYNLIVAPSEISLLAEAPIKARASMVESFRNNIPVEFGTVGEQRSWKNGAVGQSKLRNDFIGTISDSATPIAMTAGMDYQISKNWLVGGGFSISDAKQPLSTGGSFTQDELAISAYSAYRKFGAWFNSIATAGVIDSTVNRRVPLGITTQRNQGTSIGTNVSMAIQTGYDFNSRIGWIFTPGKEVKITHGPVLGVVAQQANIHGFTESNADGNLTALSFGAQRRNSAVTELGYQTSINLGMLTPFAKISHQHELVNDNRLITTSLTTVTAPSYTMPAAQSARNWTASTIGVRARINSTTSGYAALGTQYGPGIASNYNASVGVSVSF